MLVLSRKVEEEIVIGDDIVITVIGIGANKIRIGIKAPEHVKIDRGEFVRDEDKSRDDF